jgi:transcriptional regulator with XRE-family HTH domain
MRKNPRQGQNIRLFRQLRGLKQEALAAISGET